MLSSQRLTKQNEYEKKGTTNSNLQTQVKVVYEDVLPNGWKKCEPNGKRKGGRRSVSRVLSAAETAVIVIHLGRPSPDASSNLPGSGRGQRQCFPIWSCSGRGLPCHCRYRQRGALLPHLFTLTCQDHDRRYIFCGTFRRLAPPRRYLATCPVEPGLSSVDKQQRLSDRLPVMENIGNRGRLQVSFKQDPGPGNPITQAVEKPGSHAYSCIIAFLRACMRW